MGVKGLSKFIEQQECYKLGRISGSLVIDGNGLQFNGLKTDVTYHKFYTEVKEFFTVLKDCGIQPVVIFDGLVVGRRESQKKRRNKDLISYNKIQNDERECHGEALGWWSAKRGILTKDILLWSLKELDIEVRFADGEADREIVVCANKLRCPVLSCDSDFCIFEITEGYIPFKKFAVKWKEAKEKGLKELEVEVFHFEKFANAFKFPMQYRLLFPAILGNDYVEALRGEARTEVTVYDVIRIAISYQRFKSFSEFLEDIKKNDQEIAAEGSDQSPLDGINRKDLIKNCEKAQSYYDTDEGAQPPTPEFSNLPSWILEQYRAGRLHKTVISIFVEKFCFLRHAVEDFKCESSHCVSRDIRACTYSIILGQGQDLVVHEHARSSCKAVMEDCPVKPVILDPTIGFTLDNIEDKGKALCKILSCQHEVIWKFPAKWRLILAATLFWCQKVTPNPSNMVIKILVACFVCCDCDKTFDDLQALEPNPQLDYMTHLKVLHALAQWQQIYLDALTLNEVLMEPFECMNPVKFFDGDIVMFFASLQYRETSTKFFLRSLLKKKGVKIYKKLLSLIKKSLPKPKKTKLHNPAEYQLTLTNRFQILETLGDAEI